MTLLQELKESEERILAKGFSQAYFLHNPWDRMDLMEAVKETRFPTIQFINRDQVVWDIYPTDEEMTFRNQGLEYLN